MCGLMSSDRVSMNWMKIWSSWLILSGSRHEKPGGQLHLVCPDCDSGPPLCALNDEGGHPSVVLGISADVRFSSSFGVHEVGHLVMLMSPVHQFISGLCSMSHVCLRMIVVWPMPVTCNVAHSSVFVSDYQI